MPQIEFRDNKILKLCFDIMYFLEKLVIYNAYSLTFTHTCDIINKNGQYDICRRIAQNSAFVLRG